MGRVSARRERERQSEVERRRTRKRQARENSKIDDVIIYLLFLSLSLSLLLLLSTFFPPAASSKRLSFSLSLLHISLLTITIASSHLTPPHHFIATPQRTPTHVHSSFLSVSTSLSPLSLSLSLSSSKHFFLSNNIKIDVQIYIPKRWEINHLPLSFSLSLSPSLPP